MLVMPLFSTKIGIEAPPLSESVISCTSPFSSEIETDQAPGPSCPTTEFEAESARMAAATSQT